MSQSSPKKQKVDEEKKDDFPLIAKAQAILDRNHVDIVVYHDKCSDGLTAACIADNFLRGAKLIPGTHGDVNGPKILEQVDGATNLLIVDFSFPLEIMEKLNKICKTVLLLDHHISAQKELGHLSYCLFDQNRSGAMLAWDYFHPDLPAPPFVAYVQDRDLWKHKLPFSREFNTMQYAMPYDMDAYKGILWEPSISSPGMAKMITDGIAVCAYQKSLFDKVEVKIIRLDEDQVFAFANYPHTLASEVGNAIVLREDVPAFIWSYDPKAGDVQCSLRSADHLADVSIIAKELGGGGHRNAAGCRMTMEALGLLLSGKLLYQEEDGGDEDEAGAGAEDKDEGMEDKKAAAPGAPMPPPVRKVTTVK